MLRCSGPARLPEAGAGFRTGPQLNGCSAAMPRPATGRKKEAILDAAVVEIASHGYHGTTVAMIARRAGVADGTIYLYFQNKEEILVSLFDRAMDRFVEQGARELAGLNDPAARLARIIELHLELVGSDRDLAIITQVELRHSLHFLDQLSRAKVGAYLQAIAGDHRRRAGGRPLARRPGADAAGQGRLRRPRRDGHRLGAVAPQHPPAGEGRSRGRLRDRRPASASPEPARTRPQFHGTRLVDSRPFRGLFGHRTRAVRSRG